MENADLQHVKLAYQHVVLRSQRADAEITPIHVLQQDNFIIPILYADEHFLCIDKPPFLRIDAKESVDANGNPSITAESILSDQLLATSVSQAVSASESRSNISCLKHVHQLDANTSGVLLYAKHKLAASEACRLFEERSVEKTYLAIVHGHIDVYGLLKKAKRNAPADDLSDSHTSRDEANYCCLHAHMVRIDAWIQTMNDRQCAIVPEPSHQSATLAGKGYPQAATTLLRPLLHIRIGSEQDPATLVQLRPETGRRHQIRVHCAAIGHAIVGDWLYERAPSIESGRMFLHAFRLEMTFPDQALLDGKRKRGKRGRLVPRGTEQRRSYAWQSAPPFMETVDPAAWQQILEYL